MGNTRKNKKTARSRSPQDWKRLEAKREKERTSSSPRPSKRTIKPPVKITRIDGSTEIYGARNNGHDIDYETYIQSPAWNSRKAAYYKRHPRQCSACGTKSKIHLHHHTYDRLGMEEDYDLIPLCETHHEAVHWEHLKNGRLRHESLQECTYRVVMGIRKSSGMV